MSADIIKVDNINARGFGCIPKIVMQDRRLSLQAKGIYAFLASYAGAGKAAFPCLKTILYYLNIGQDTYYRHLKTLIKYGYIRADKQKNDRGQFWRTVYTLCTDITPPLAENTQVDEQEKSHKTGESKSEPLNDLPLAENPQEVNPQEENPQTYNKQLRQLTDNDIISQSIIHSQTPDGLIDRFADQVELDYFAEEMPEAVPTVKLLIKTMCEQYAIYSELIDRVDSCTVLSFLDELKRIDFSKVKNIPKYTQSVFINFLISENIEMMGI